jgi:DNA gyrase subunit A
VSGISQMGRPTQGVRVMNMKSDDRVSAVALVVESGDEPPDESGADELPVDEAIASEQSQDGTGGD